MITSLKWFVALTKRLFKNVAFVLTLCLIPLCVLAVELVSHQTHGLVTVVLSCDSIDDKEYLQIKNEFLSGDSVINFYAVDDPEKAENDVISGKADSAWIFSDNLELRLNEYVDSRHSKPLCRVLLRQDTVFTSVAREKLYGKLLCLLSKNYCYDFVSDRVDADKEKLYAMYDEERKGYTEDFVNFQYIGKDNTSLSDNNYITSPIRGLLSLSVLVSIMAAMMLSIDDEKRGRYTYFPVKRRILIHISACFSGGAVCAIIAVAAMYFAGINVSFLREMAIMLLLVIASVGFVCLIGFVMSSITGFSYAIPFVVFVTVALCPVFLNTNGNMLIKSILPAYHYLNSVYSDSGIAHLAVYSVLVYPLCYIVYYLKNLRHA